MNTTNNIFARCAPTAVCVALWLLGTAAATAQRWEYVYGADDCDEVGINNVAPVNSGGGFCGYPNAMPTAYPHGYISIGSTYSNGNGGCNNTRDVYIVRTNNAGAVMWTYAYDIGGVSRDDIGYSIKELAIGGGFIVTGVTDFGSGNTDIFIMQINCNGTVAWVNTYGGNQDDMAYDIIETTSGNPLLGTQLGDFVVAGYTLSAPNNTVNPYLLRTTSAGGLIWDAAYELSPVPVTGAPDDWFNSLIEATPNGPANQVTGDIVAVGATMALFTPALAQAIVARVDGNTGAIAAGAPSLQNFAAYGGALHEEFYEVRQLTVGGQNGNLAFAGYTISTPGGNGADVYVVTNGGDPCTAPIADANPIAIPPNQEGAYGLREVTITSGLMTAGDLALTGYSDFDGAGTDIDMFLLTLAPANLAVTGGALFGIPANGNNEAGHSLYEVATGNGRTAGFILCGYTTSDPANDMDPQDMYLVKTNANDSTLCSFDWTPNKYDTTWSNSCLNPIINSVMASAASSANRLVDSTNDPACDYSASKRVGEPTGNGALQTGRAGDDPMRILRSYPNPVRKGESLNLAFSPASKQSIRVTVTNSLGTVVRDLSIPNTGTEAQFSVSTEGLAAGAYLLHVSDGIRGRWIRIIVAE